MLVLSGLAGAAQELENALIISPYDVDSFAAERLQLGLGHPGGSRKPLDQAVALFGSGLGRDVGLMGFRGRMSTKQTAVFGGCAAEVRRLIRRSATRSADLCRWLSLNA